MTRGCGNLSHNALYATWKLGARGIPIRMLTLCPTWRLDQKKLKISDTGMTLLPQLDINGKVVYNDAGDIVYDVYDVVGRKHYPFKLDFFIEGCNQGFNRRWPTSIDVDRLTPSMSIHYLCSHAACYTPDYGFEMVERYNRLAPEANLSCYKDLPSHQHPLDDRFFECCTGMWPLEVTSKYVDEIADGVFQRELPGGETYYVPEPLDKEPEWDFGAFMALPIGTFTATTVKGKPDLGPKVRKQVDKLKTMGIGYDVRNLEEEAQWTTT